MSTEQAVISLLEEDPRAGRVLEELLSGWIGRLIGAKAKNSAVLDPAVLDLYHYLMAEQMSEFSSKQQALDSLDGIEERAAGAAVSSAHGESAFNNDSEYDQLRQWEIQLLYWVTMRGLVQLRWKLGRSILEETRRGEEL
jgi:hypothetical protein